MKNNMEIIDLGAGIGTVIFKAAEKSHQLGLNTKFIAIDINPILVIIMKILRLFHKNKSNIKVVYADMFRLKFNELLTKNTNLIFYIYISPWLTNTVYKIIKKQNQKATLISYYYPVKGIRESAKIHGLHNIYLYDL